MLRVGHSSVDLVTLRVVRPDGEAVLTGFEGEIVAFMASHMDDVVSRQRLERDVWGMNDAVQSEAVPVALRRLRKKLGREAIVTVRGRGWKLVGAQMPPPASTHPVPRAHGVFIGRADVMQTARSLLKHAPVLTLRGAPAVGKTRLAVELAASFDAPTTCVSLAGVSTLAQARSRIADALALGQSDDAAIRRALDAQPSLLVLDDVDAVPDIGTHLADWVGDSGSHIVTTQVQVPADGGLSIEVPPLPPDDARTLLALRVRAVLPNVSDDDPRLAAIVAALDGLPGAIESWAGRAALGLDALLADIRDSPERLTDRLGLSTLQPSERRALDVMSVLGGVASPSMLNGLADADALHSLRHKSLVHLSENGQLMVMNAVCRAVRATVGHPLEDAVHERVFSMAEQAADVIPFDPRAGHTTLRELRPALFDVIDRGRGGYAARGLVALCRGLLQTGPKSLMVDLLRRFDERGLTENPDWGLDVWRAAVLRLSNRDPSAQVTLLQGRPEPEARLLLASALARRGELTEALSVLQTLIDARDPADPYRIEAQVRCLLSDIRATLAESRFDALATETIDQARRLGLPRLEQRARMAMAAEHVMNPSVALHHLHEALRLQDRIGVVTTQTLEVWNVLGVVHAETDPRKALMAWSQCAQLARQGGIDDTMLTLNRLLAHLELRDDDAVLAVDGDVFRGQPIQHAMWQIARATALIATGQPQAATLLELQIDWPAAGLPVTAERDSHGAAIRTLVDAERDIAQGTDVDGTVQRALSATADARRPPRATLARLLARRLERAVQRPR